MIRQQNTLKKEVSFSGIGVHCGQEIQMRFVPAAENEGIVFQRVDLKERPKIPALAKYAQATPRCTTLTKEGVSIQTIEHVLAALRAYEIDNLLIELTSPEPPIADGSSLKFVEMIEEVGIARQDGVIQVHQLEQPVFFSHHETHLVALPSDTYKISCTLDYPNSKIIRSQYYSFEVSPEAFKHEVASARTFALYEEIKILMEKKLIQGGSLDNAVVVKEDVIFSKDGLRYPNEMVRHKVLDLVGDLALVPFPFVAHIIAIRSGHQANAMLAQKIEEQIIKNKKEYVRG